MPTFVTRGEFLDYVTADKTCSPPREFYNSTPNSDLLMSHATTAVIFTTESVLKEHFHYGCAALRCERL